MRTRHNYDKLAMHGTDKYQRAYVTKGRAAGSEPYAPTEWDQLANEVAGKLFGSLDVNTTVLARKIREAAGKHTVEEVRPVLLEEYDPTLFESSNPIGVFITGLPRLIRNTLDLDVQAAQVVIGTTFLRWGSELLGLSLEPVVWRESFVTAIPVAREMRKLQDRFGFECLYDTARRFSPPDGSPDEVAKSLRSATERRFRSGGYKADPDHAIPAGAKR